MHGTYLALVFLTSIYRCNRDTYKKNNQLRILRIPFKSFRSIFIFFLCRISSSHTEKKDRTKRSASIRFIKERKHTDFPTLTAEREGGGKERGQTISSHLVRSTLAILSKVSLIIKANFIFVVTEARVKV